jgi:hypothetical protein
MLTETQHEVGEGLLLVGVGLGWGRGASQHVFEVINSGLARPQKWVESPIAVSRMLKVLMLTETKHEVREGLL